MKTTRKMRTTRKNPAAILTLAILATAAAAPAATFSTPYSNPGPDGDPFLYEGKLTLNAGDSWSTTVTPGAWSFRDLKPSANPNRGWGHTSAWFLVELTSASQLMLGMNTSSTIGQPGFTLYSGESINDAPADAHTFSNNGLDLVLLNDGWDNNGTAGAPGLVYTGNGFNGVTQNLNGSFTLPAGLYTIAFGNAADSTAAPAAIPYTLTFAAVPEPSCAMLAAAAGMLAVSRRRR